MFHFIGSLSGQNRRSRPFRRFGLILGLLAFTALSFTPQPIELASAQSNLATFSENITPDSPPPAASVSVQVQVPASMQGSPFNVSRFLTVPVNFSISVYARVSEARFMAITPKGDLLVSQPNQGKVKLVRPNPTLGSDPLISDFVSGLTQPHDIVFHNIGSTTYIYIAESNQINRYVYAFSDITINSATRQVVVANLPDVTSPGLGSQYNHRLKNIALDGNHKLYVSVASRSNADPTLDPQNVPDPRGAVYQYNADGTGGRLFAKGLRNAEGLAMIPGTNTLWVAVNNRDQIPCPNTVAPCSSLGQVTSAYVDNHPPEEFTSVRDGGNYGWPFCNPNPDTANGYNNMPFELDMDNNSNGAQLNCSTADRISKGIQAHSAPLGLTFLQDTTFPELYRSGVTIGLHGSWNRQVKTGYKIIYFPWDSATQTPGAQMDLVAGWQDGPNSNWGRPVDTAVDLTGNMLISDDGSGTIYKLTYNRSTQTVVTKATDDSLQGSLSYLLNSANQGHAQAGDTITFDPLIGTDINISSSLPIVPAGVTIQGGSCSSFGPRITLKWTGPTTPNTINGLILNGGATIHNLKVKGFPGNQIVVTSNSVGNKLGPCVVTQK